MIKPKETFLAGEMSRWHTHDDPRLRRCGETVGAHAWGVSMLVQWLDPECNKDTLLYALTHDVGERGLGFDMSGPAKKRHPLLARNAALVESAEHVACVGVPGDDVDYDLVGACDQLHALLRSIHETHGEVDWTWANDVISGFDLYMQDVVRGLINDF